MHSRGTWKEEKSIGLSYGEICRYFRGKLSRAAIGNKLDSKWKFYEHKYKFLDAGMDDVNIPRE